MILEHESLEIYLPEQLDETLKIELRPRLSQLVVIDASSVKQVRPEGLQILIHFFRTLDSRIHFAFRNMPSVLIKAFNRTADSLPPIYKVENFEWPMECFDCEFSEMEWVERGKDYLESQNANDSGVINLPMQLNCPSCQGMMEPAEKLESYLRFLKTQDGRYEAD